MIKRFKRPAALAEYDFRRNKGDFWELHGVTLINNSRHGVKLEVLRQRDLVLCVAAAGNGGFARWQSEAPIYNMVFFKKSDFSLRCKRLT